MYETTICESGESADLRMATFGWSRHATQDDQVYAMALNLAMGGGTAIAPIPVN